MADVNNYKCPACSGTMHYDADSKCVVCDYCGGSYDVNAIEEIMKNSSDSSEMNKADEWTCNAVGWDAQGMNAYSCPSCGAGLVCDDSTAATSCPYCGNPTIVPAQFEGVLKPQYIIPFKIDRNKTKDKVEKYYKKKLFVPKEFKETSEFHDVQGVYVPFWLYDGIAYGSAEYHGEKVHTSRKGDYEIKRTDHYEIVRQGEARFEKIPADASSKMPDALMDSIEPYDYKGLEPFSQGYIAGYLADRYDVSKEECSVRAKKRAEKTLENLIDDTVTGYNNKTKRFSHVRVKEGTISYAMLPVWMMSTKYRNKDYLFAMNGQTGKMVGELPMDKLKAFITTIIAYLIPFVIAVALSGGITGATTWSMVGKYVLLPGVIALLTFLFFKSQLKNVRVAKTSNNYIVGKGLKLTFKRDQFTHSTETRRKLNK